MHLISGLLGSDPLLNWRRSRRNLSPLELRIINELNTEGVSITSVGELTGTTDPLSVAADAVARGAELVRAHSARVVPAIWTRGLASTDLTAEALLEKAPQIFLLGLQDPVLKLAQAYLCRPVAYHGAVLRHSLLDGTSRGPRLWHQDGEDIHVLRMVVYLNDVTLDGGPFEYIPRNNKVSYRDFVGFENQITDTRMQQVVRAEQWRQVTGPAGTVVLCDTARTFHHESLQKRNERAVIMLGYSSQRPTGLNLARLHFPAERVRPRLSALVAPVHSDIVFGWRG